MDADGIIRFFLSKCCRAGYRAGLTEEGEWGLYCEKCGKCCGTLEEKYTIDSRLLIL